MDIGSEEYRGWLRFDPRTKLFYVLTVGCFCLTLLGADAYWILVVRCMLAISPFLLLLANGRVRGAVFSLIAIVGCFLVASFVLPYAGGFIGWMLYASTGIVTRLLPSAMTAYWLLSTTTASELIAALQRMHVPQSVTISLAVMFRFFPTAVAEQRSINDAMIMRGVRFGGGKMSEILEYRVVPLMTNSVRIADELSQAALTRGLGAGKRRTSIARIGFRFSDALVWLLCLGCFAVWALTSLGVLA